MTKLISYLTFNGNCREAMLFYQSCLGGELHLQSVGDSPLSDRLPAVMKEFILHASLEKGALQLMATDLVGDAGYRKGNNVSLLIECYSESELNEYYYRLSEGGSSPKPVGPTFWGALFGEVTDRYGNHWLLHFNE